LFDVVGPALVDQKLGVSLRQLTLRESGPLLRVLWPATGGASGLVPPNLAGCRIAIEANDCVFQLKAAQAALFEWLGTSGGADWLASIRMRGEGSVTLPGVPIAARVDIATDQRTDLASDGFELEGLMAAPFEFGGPLSDAPRDSTIRFCDAPRRSDLPPGIDPTRLPDGDAQ
jgi:hypothetical protein